MSGTSGLTPAYLLDIATRRARDPDPDRCLVAPSPELQERLREQLQRLREVTDPNLGSMLRFQEPRALGLNDGTIIPPEEYPPGTPARTIRAAASARAPLRGTVRVIVVLVDFADRPMANDAHHFQDLFFSTGVLPKGSVREYYREVTHGLIDIQGQVVGPYHLPHPEAYYANGHSGTGAARPNAQDMAYDAVVAADPAVDFTPYDNDGNGLVDAFIVIHAGTGGEVTGSANDIWSHKWVLPGGAYNADAVKVYGYLTVPEDCKIGVCCHELGHLLFGWPDLYDTDYSSSGIGNWCLMAGGSWDGNGDVPCHPSAWCKAGQGWISVVNEHGTEMVSIADVKDSQTAYRLWKDGAAGTEYFLIENRQRTRFDQYLPGDGLLIWHVDDSVSSNDDEHHYKVALVQADGLRQLESSAGNRGDAGDPFPGSTSNTGLAGNTNPNSNSYLGVATGVSVTRISASGPTMTAQLSVAARRRQPRRRDEATLEELQARIAALEARLGGALTNGSEVHLAGRAGR
jgi:immune inhibitor A